MALPLALTLPQLFTALGVGMGTLIVASRADSPTMREIKSAQKKATLVGGLKLSGGTAKERQVIPTGPLPAQAIAAYNSKKKGKGRSRSAYGSKNDIHKKGTWFRFATYSDKWDRKLEKIRYYAKPNGALYVKKTSKPGNLAWMARAPKSWYPGYKKAKALNVRFPGVEPWLGPKADWSTVKGAFKKSVQGIPAVVKAAGVVVAGVYSGGSSLTKDTAKQGKAVEDGIKAAIAPMYGAGKGSDRRIDAAREVVTALRSQYLKQMMDANPWAVKNGKLDIGKHYMANPKTWEDLFKPGKSRPLLFNPPESK